MTRLTKPVWREVATKYATLMVALTPAGFVAREKRKRKVWGPLGYDTLFILAVNAEVEAKRRERAKAKRAKARGGKR